MEWNRQRLEDSLLGPPRRRREVPLDELFGDWLRTPPRSGPDPSILLDAPRRHTPGPVTPLPPMLPPPRFGELLGPAPGGPRKDFGELLAYFLTQYHAISERARKAGEAAERVANGMGRKLGDVIGVYNHPRSQYSAALRRTGGTR
jgi:hypothetical protein